MAEILESINRFLWGVPTLLLILCVGIYYTLRTGFLQIRALPKAIAQFLGMLGSRKNSRSGNSSYRALCTALAATVGTGNLIGVAGAICLGGPGAIFWMWICGFLGMIIKYAETVLAIRFRQRDERGSWTGGPMFIIQNGLSPRFHWLAKLYCVFGLIASFGVGNATQVNAVIGGINSILSGAGILPTWITNLLAGIILSAVLGAILLGGAKRIGEAAERLVPAAAVVYIVLCIGVLAVRWEKIDDAFSAIILGAFHPEAVTGGMLGSAFSALRVGAARGIFTNEAGMGTASIAHAGAEVEDPCIQGRMGIMEVFIDTLVICTLTALVILCSGMPICYGKDLGPQISSQAFSAVYGNWVSIPLTLCLCCFAGATILGWGLYGLRFAQYLFAKTTHKSFAVIQIMTIIVGSVMGTGVIWTMAEAVNALMAIPNLLALLLLSPEVLQLTRISMLKKESEKKYNNRCEGSVGEQTIKSLSKKEWCIDFK